MKTKIKSGINSVFVTSLVLAILVVFLSPFAFMVLTSLKTREQISVVGAPIWPAAQPKYEYNGKDIAVSYTHLGIDCRKGLLRQDVLSHC